MLSKTDINYKHGFLKLKGTKKDLSHFVTHTHIHTNLKLFFVLFTSQLLFFSYQCYYIYNSKLLTNKRYSMNNRANIDVFLLFMMMTNTECFAE